MRTLTRREVLAWTTTLALSGGLARARASARRRAELARRALAGTGRSLPALGLGCFPLGNVPAADDGVAVVRRAYASGARYFDSAPSYHRGESERRVGRGLAGLPREELYVATKTLQRDGEAALAELEQSLERLGLDYVDSVQVHEVHDDVESLFAKDGVVAALAAERGRENARLRHVGLTCHRDPSFALQALERFDFATALVPVNPLDLQHRSFVRDFLPVARERGVGVIAMKVYAGGALARGERACPAGDLLRFALHQPGVCVAVPGAATVDEWAEARAAADLGPLSDTERSALLERVGQHQGKSSEWYKDA